MPHEESELAVAQAVSVAALDFGLGFWGEPVRVDDGSSEQQVDFQFDTLSATIALEVTSIVDAPFIATANASLDRVDQLRHAARERGIGKWIFVLLPDAVVREVIPLLVAMIQSDHAPPAGRSVDDLPEGVDALWYEPGAEDAGEIMTMSSSTAGSLSGMTDEVQTCVDDNAGKLLATDAERRFLAVDIQALHATDPARTRVPNLPDGIDGVFVVRRHTSPIRGSPVVWYSDGTSPWMSNGETWE